MENEIKGSSLPSVAALAYIGDARHSLYVRVMLTGRGLTKSADLNREALKYVTAEAQAAAYEKIKELLTDSERGVFKRAANSTHLNKPKHASGREYRYATGFEAVIGMLTWLGDEERIKTLFERAYTEDKENDTQD